MIEVFTFRAIWVSVLIACSLTIHRQKYIYFLLLLVLWRWFYTKEAQTSPKHRRLEKKERNTLFVTTGKGTAIKTPRKSLYYPVVRWRGKLLTRVSSLSFRLQGNKKERKAERVSMWKERKHLRVFHFLDLYFVSGTNCFWDKLYPSSIPHHTHHYFPLFINIWKVLDLVVIAFISNACVLNN